MAKRPEHEFVIRYKSGTEVRVRADSLKVHWDTSEGTAVKMEWSNMQPRPMAIGLVNIESVWELI